MCWAATNLTTPKQQRNIYIYIYMYYMYILITLNKAVQINYHTPIALIHVPASSLVGPIVCIMEGLAGAGAFLVLLGLDGSVVLLHILHPKDRVLLAQPGCKHVWF